MELVLVSLVRIIADENFNFAKRTQYESQGAQPRG